MAPAVLSREPKHLTQIGISLHDHPVKLMHENISGKKTPYVSNIVQGISRHMLKEYLDSRSKGRDVFVPVLCESHDLLEHLGCDHVTFKNLQEKEKPEGWTECPLHGYHSYVYRVGHAHLDYFRKTTNGSARRVIFVTKPIKHAGSEYLLTYMVGGGQGYSQISLDAIEAENLVIHPGDLLLLARKT